jgi:hypothetical protein
VIEALIGLVVGVVITLTVTKSWPSSAYRDASDDDLRRAYDSAERMYRQYVRGAYPALAGREKDSQRQIGREIARRKRAQTDGE